MSGMTKEEAVGLFTLAGFQIKHVWELPNGYWPLSSHYDEIRRTSPWWLVWTETGPVEIGWRKNVISINWSQTNMRRVVTEDDVTKSATDVHAWGASKALEYLTALRTPAPSKGEK